MVLSEATGGPADSLAGEDLVDLRPGAEVGQKHLIGRLSEDVRLHAVILKYKAKLLGTYSCRGAALHS